MSKFTKFPGLPAFLIFLMVSIAGTGLWGCGKSEQKEATAAGTAADAMPIAARIDRLDGEVGIDRQIDNQGNNSAQPGANWVKAGVNAPVSIGTRI